MADILPAEGASCCSRDFLATYGTASFPYATQLVSSLRAGIFTNIQRLDRSLPCRHFAEIYRRRAESLEQLCGRDPGMWREFTDLVHNFGISPDEPCRVWRFIGAEHCFIVFEMVASQRIAGCFRRKGSEV